MLTTDRGLVSPGTNENNVVLVGQGLMRTTSTFNNATLNGNSVSVSEGLALNGDSESYGRKIQVGVIDWDGKGNLTGSADVNSAGFVTLAADNPIAGTYSVDADGRVTVTATKGYFAPKIYLVGPNQGFAVEASAAVPFYQFENQIVPAGGFTADSFNGDYSFGSLWYSFVQETALSGEIAVDDGAESANGTLDQNTAGQIAVNQATSYSYTPSPTGRFVKWVGSTAENAIYMVSPSNAYSIDISGKPWSTLFEYNIQQAPVTP
jgi:hypothetical protein